MKTAGNERKSSMKYSFAKHIENADYAGRLFPQNHIEIENLVRQGINRKVAEAYYRYRNKRKDPSPPTKA